jgi:hypothetical protein
MSIWSEIEDRSEGTVRKEDFDIDSMLPKGIVHFKFKKKLPKGVTDESKAKIREAWGTKKMAIVDKIPHGGSCPPKNAGYTIYFDLERSDWRAFRNDRLVYIEDKIYSEDEFFEKIYPTLVGDK